MTQKEFQIKVFSLSERIYPMMVRMIGKVDAEDAIQEIMIKLWKKRKELSAHPNIKGLTFLTARNYCIDVLRKTKQKDEREISHLHIINSKKESDNIEWQELNQIIQKILQKLPKQQKEVFELKDIDGFETDEIAEMLEIRHEYVRVLLSRARKQIGIQLENKYKYERGIY